jgi:hypothetical protein
MRFDRLQEEAFLTGDHHSFNRMAMKPFMLVGCQLLVRMVRGQYLTGL